MQTVICDICGKSQEDLFMTNAQIRRYTKTSGKWWQSARTIEEQFDICDECLMRIRNEMKESKCETSKTETAKETPKAIYEGFNSHDCETRYKCPVCNGNFGSWSLPSCAKIANCPCCGTELRFQ